MVLALLPGDANAHGAEALGPILTVGGAIAGLAVCGLLAMGRFRTTWKEVLGLLIAVGVLIAVEFLAGQPGYVLVAAAFGGAGLLAGLAVGGLLFLVARIIRGAGKEIERKIGR